MEVLKSQKRDSRSFLLSWVGELIRREGGKSINLGRKKNGAMGGGKKKIRKDEERGALRIH